jgi:uncharacterized membrane protein
VCVCVCVCVCLYVYVFVSELGKVEISKTYDTFIMSVYKAHFAISVDAVIGTDCENLCYCSERIGASMRGKCNDQIRMEPHSC